MDYFFSSAASIFPSIFVENKIINKIAPSHSLKLPARPRHLADLLLLRLRPRVRGGRSEGGPAQAQLEAVATQAGGGEEERGEEVRGGGGAGGAGGHREGAGGVRAEVMFLKMKHQFSQKKGKITFVFQKN